MIAGALGACAPRVEHCVTCVRVPDPSTGTSCAASHCNRLFTRPSETRAGHGAVQILTRYSRRESFLANTASSSVCAKNALDAPMPQVWVFLKKPGVQDLIPYRDKPRVDGGHVKGIQADGQTWGFEVGTGGSGWELIPGVASSAGSTGVRLSGETAA